MNITQAERAYATKEDVYTADGDAVTVDNIVYRANRTADALVRPGYTWINIANLTAKEDLHRQPIALHPQDDGSFLDTAGRSWVHTTRVMSCAICGYQITNLGYMKGPDADDVAHVSCTVWHR